MLAVFAACYLVAHFGAEAVTADIDSDVYLQSDLIAEDTLEVHNPMEVSILQCLS